MDYSVEGSTFTKQTKNNIMNQIIKAQFKKQHREEITTQEWWDFIATQDKAEVTEVVTKMLKVIKRLQEYRYGFHNTTKIRPFCNQHGWSDIYPYEVVRVISATCVEVRPMVAEQVVFPKQFLMGGFVAHCADNQNQKYTYTSNPTAPVERIRKGKKGWGGGKFKMSNAPLKFYDYNF